MSTIEQKTLLQQQLEELVRVGVGGKFKSNSGDYTKKIEEELQFEERCKEEETPVQSLQTAH